MLLAIVRFACWEAALFAAAIYLACRLPWRDQERWLAVLAIQVTLESSVAALFSFSGWNAPWAYWLVAAICAASAIPLFRGCSWQLPKWSHDHLGMVSYAALAALATPLILLSFKPVEEIDSINYLHYLIDWMANRATPYTFATNYVAFWELTFLPAWVVSRMDWFFPLLALKAILLMALALWLVGRELGLPRPLLLWTIAGSLAMQHFWFGPSGVPTLKNDPLHGIGFVLMLLVVLRAARGPLASADLVLLAFGVAFAAVKYTGIFEAAAVVVVLLLLRRLPLRSALVLLASFLLTSGHYYLHNLVLYGSPFYPFQLNLGPLHLPGTADLSSTSILYSLRDPRLWRILFLPEGGVSPAGILFPAILPVTLLATVWLCLAAAISWFRRRPGPRPVDWFAFLVLCGWMLYFRSVFSASASAGDLAFLHNGLNSIRYVDGILALSELLLVVLLARFPWLAGILVTANLASRLAILYGHLELFRLLVWAGVSLAVFAVFLLLRRCPLPVAVASLIVACPWLVEHNRQTWTTYWNDLKPSLATVHGQGVAELALPDGGYFAGHVVAAGNPVDPGVRALLPEELTVLPESARPRYLAVLVAPGSAVSESWESRYGAQIRSWGYRIEFQGKSGALYHRVIADRAAAQLQ